MHSPIAIVGAGRVGCAFAIALRKHGAPVIALAARDRARAEDVGKWAGGLQVVSVGDWPGMAQRILIAVSDTAIPEVAGQLNEAGFAHGAVLHTSGCRGPEALSRLTASGVSTGALHPLQTF